MYPYTDLGIMARVIRLEQHCEKDCTAEGEFKLWQHLDITKKVSVVPGRIAGVFILNYVDKQDRKRKARRFLWATVKRRLHTVLIKTDHYYLWLRILSVAPFEAGILG